MYDWPETTPDWDRFWEKLREAIESKGVPAPQCLARTGDHRADWTDPDLLVGQTCGWPFVSHLVGKVEPFARFDFGLGGTKGNYHSVIIASSAQKEALALIMDQGAAIAINGFDSQSGFRSLSTLLAAPLELPVDRFVVTGGHRNSVKAVAEGQAAFAAIDAVSWRLAQQYEPAANRVREIGRTGSAPGLPLITSLKYAQFGPALLQAMADTVAMLAPQMAIGLKGVVAAKAADYAVLSNPPYDRLRVARPA